MSLTREMGTRKLVALFVLVLIAFVAFGKVRERQLLATPWPGLPADTSGLTLVGTLDSKSSLGRNMFRVLDINQSFRPEITDYGWNSIFSGPSGSTLSEQSGQAIKYALTQDSRVGYAMLQPYLAYGVAMLQRRPDAGSLVQASLLVRVPEKKKKGFRMVTLGRLLAESSGKGGSGGESGGEEGQSSGAVDVEHGLAVPGDVLVAACPVVLTGRHFSGAEIEEEDQPLLDSKTYTAHLYLTDEGRSRFYQWTHDHLAEHVVFILNGEVLAAARVNMTMNGDEWEVGPLRDGAAAKRLVDFVNSHRNRAAH
jgi:hypothetical protein